MNQSTAPSNDILFEQRDGIGRVTFNRPQARNAFTFAMYERLAQICEEADGDRAIKVLVFQGAGDNADGSGWWAPWACWEDDGHLHLELELPGVAKDDLELVTHQGKLLVKCQRKAPEEGKQFRFNTRRYGEFERVISLPDTIDTDAIQAELRDGVLHVTLNKRAEAQPKRINVGG